MPYIKQFRRKDIIEGEFLAKSAGELNWMLTEVLSMYIKAHGLSYQTINDIVGALEGAKLEFYRRIAVPYENTKITENGDVY